MPELNVLVTGVGGAGLGEQIIKALRLADTHYFIVGCDMSAQSMGLAEVDAAYILPPARSEHYIEALLTVCKHHKVAAVFPGSEPELRVMSDSRAVIEAHGIFVPINPNEVIALCTDKVKTCDVLSSLGFCVPIYRSIKALSDLEAFPVLPAVLKPSVGGGGSANLFLAQTRRELMLFGEYLLSLYPEFIVQEYIGTPDMEFTVGVLLDMDGALLNSIALKRHIMSGLSNRIKVSNRTGRTDLGPLLALSSGVSQGEIGSFPQVTKQCEDIAIALGCRSAVNIQCRLVGEKAFVFEINPRYSGTTSLRAMVGYNEPDVLIRKHLLGETITQHFPYRHGMILRGLRESFVDISRVQEVVA